MRRSAALYELRKGIRHAPNGDGIEALAVIDQQRPESGFAQP
jgi:hypothetical protein